jgi:hypothetical protein
VGHASRSNSRFSTRRCRGRRIRVVDRGRTVPPWSRDTSAPPVGRRLQASRGLPRTARWQCSVCPRSHAVVEAAEREPEKFGRLLAQMDFAARSKLPSSSPLRLQPNRVGVTFAFASAALTGSRSSNDCGRAAASECADDCNRQGLRTAEFTPDDAGTRCDTDSISTSRPLPPWRRFTPLAASESALAVGACARSSPTHGRSGVRGARRGAARAHATRGDARKTIQREDARRLGQFAAPTRCCRAACAPARMTWKRALRLGKTTNVVSRERIARCPVQLR